MDFSTDQLLIDYADELEKIKNLRYSQERSVEDFKAVVEWRKEVYPEDTYIELEDYVYATIRWLDMWHWDKTRSDDGDAIVDKFAYVSEYTTKCYILDVGISKTIGGIISLYEFKQRIGNMFERNVFTIDYTNEIGVVTLGPQEDGEESIKVKIPYESLIELGSVTANLINTKIIFANPRHMILSYFHFIHKYADKITFLDHEQYFK